MTCVAEGEEFPLSVVCDRWFLPQYWLNSELGPQKLTPGTDSIAGILVWLMSLTQHFDEQEEMILGFLASWLAGLGGSSQARSYLG